MSSDLLDNSSTPGAGPSTQSDSAFERWRSSLAQLTGLGLNPREIKLREERLAQEKLEGDWNQCEKWKTGLMKSSESRASRHLYSNTTLTIENSS
jgi:hypothetical protein